MLVVSRPCLWCVYYANMYGIHQMYNNYFMGSIVFQIKTNLPQIWEAKSLLHK